MISSTTIVNNIFLSRIVLLKSEHDEQSYCIYISNLMICLHISHLIPSLLICYCSRLLLVRMLDLIHVRRHSSCTYLTLPVQLHGDMNYLGCSVTYYEFYKQILHSLGADGAGISIDWHRV